MECVFGVGFTSAGQRYSCFDKGHPEGVPVGTYRTPGCLWAMRVSTGHEGVYGPWGCRMVKSCGGQCSLLWVGCAAPIEVACRLGYTPLTYTQAGLPSTVLFGRCDAILEEEGCIEPAPDAYTLSDEQWDKTRTAPTFRGSLTRSLLPPTRSCSHRCLACHGAR